MLGDWHIHSSSLSNLHTHTQNTLHQNQTSTIYSDGLVVTLMPDPMEFSQNIYYAYCQWKKLTRIQNVLIWAIYTEYKYTLIQRDESECILRMWPYSNFHYVIATAEPLKIPLNTSTLQKWGLVLYLSVHTYTKL